MENLMNLVLKRTGSRLAAGLLSGAFILTLLAPGQAAEAPASFADLAAKVTPAVVNISSKHRVAEAAGESTGELPFNAPPGSPLEDFFRHFNERQHRQGSQV